MTNSVLDNVPFYTVYIFDIKIYNLHLNKICHIDILLRTRLPGQFSTQRTI